MDKTAGCQNFKKLLNNRSGTKLLAFATVVGLAGLGISTPVQAENHTLPIDSLANDNAINTNLTQNYPENLSSAYTLTKIENADQNNLPKNTIILYNQNAQTGAIEPVYYTLTLNKTTYGTGEDKKYFQFKEVDGNYQLIQIDNPTTDNTTITINHDITTQIKQNISTSTENIINDFVGITSTTLGGAIYNSDIITNLSGDFVNNTVKYDSGGAIYNNGGIIKNIQGDFINNKTGYSAGAINNTAEYNNTKSIITNIKGNFIGNNTESNGGAILNYARRDSANATINSITGNFIGNYSNSDGGAISNIARYNDTTAIINNITGDFIGNYTSNNGGAIFNSNPDGQKSLIDNITGDFVGNHSNNQGGAIYNNFAVFNTITSNFIGNYTTNNGGAIYNSGTLKTIKGDFISNYITDNANAIVNGGAIYNEGTISDGIINSNFFNNYVSTQSGKALGGAIYTTTDLNIIADNETSTFKGNYTLSGNVIDDNAIYLDSNTAILKLEAKNNGTINLYDNIRGTNGYNVLFTGDNSSNINLNNYVYGLANVTLNNVKLNLSADNYLDGNNVTFNGGKLNMINNQTGLANFNSLTLNGNTDLTVDVDLKEEQMDRISAGSYTLTDGATINVVGMNMLSDMKDGQDVAEILFADKDLKDAVSGNLDLPNESYQTTFFTPIFKYNAIYDNRENEGYFVFTRGDKIIKDIVNEGGITSGGMSSTGNISDRYNPAVLASSSSATVGTVGTLNTTFNYTFNHADAFMNSPSHHRFAYKTRNRYAISDTDNVGRFNPLFLEQDEYAGVWVRPYSTFETVSLKNGPKVDNIGYGTLIGFDSELESLKNGWDRVLTGYVGYNGASQSYSGVDSTQNGGLLGGTVTLYKGNFFNATTLNVGASVAENDTMYGNEDFTMLMSGLGNKTGYNLEFKDGKVILQPNMFIGYSFVNTFDYTNAAGVKIDNKPLHALQVAPGVKIIGNSKEGWQPYASVSMVWNLMGETDATANGHKLPEMSIKPYVQYGIGIQRKIKDKFTAYGQAMVQNGGRNGVSLSGGFKWVLGKNTEKVHNDESETKLVRFSNNKHTLKELTTEQKKNY